MIRVGIAGLGFIGQTHLANLLQCSDVEVAALADADEGRRRGEFLSVQGNITATRGELRLRGPVRSYADPVALCEDRELDAVLICLPNDLHAPLANRALESGKHVFCEKPIALSVEEGRRMIAASEAAGRILMVGHVLRFWPEFVATGEILRSGAYGRAVAASFVRCSARPRWAQPSTGDWFSNPHRSGGVVADLHIHDADLVLWWWGRPERICAGGAVTRGVISVVQSRWQYAAGPTVQFLSSWDPAAKTPFYCGFHIILEGATLLFDSRSPAGLQLATDSGIAIVPLSTDDGYQAEIGYFLQAVQGRGSLDRCPPSASLLALEYILEESRQIVESVGGA